MAGGDYYSIALQNDGTVWAWGDNGHHFLGDGTNTPSNTPVQVSGLSNITAISARRLHSLALDKDGNVWAWGENGSGQLGDGTTNPPGSEPSTPVQAQGLTNVQAVSAGGFFSLALDKDGNIWAWGANDAGQLGNGTTSPSDVPVQVIGDGSPLPQFTMIAAGFNQALAVDVDGNLWAWGGNSNGNLGIGSADANAHPYPTQISGISNVTAIAAYYNHSLAVSGGHVYAWGNGSAGELGDGTNSNHYAPTEVPDLTNIVDVAVGGYHSLARTSDGAVYAWGDNSDGRLGNGSITPSNTPVQVLDSAGTSPLTGVTQIAAGDRVSLALIGNSDTTPPTATDIIETVAGNGSWTISGDGGLATEASLKDPVGVAVDSVGDLFIADARNSDIREVTPDGQINALGVTLDEAANGLTIDGDGNLYVIDGVVVKKITSDGTVTTVAGDGSVLTDPANKGDGQSATSVGLNLPSDVAVDGSGNLYIVDYGFQVVRKVSAADGTISTVAGNWTATSDGSCEPDGDGGLATDMGLCWPNAISAESAGNLYISESGRHEVRKVATDGTITTVAGNGTDGYDGDGESATSAAIGDPAGVEVDGKGALYVSDSLHDVVRKIDLTSGTISTAAGNGTTGYSGDGGPATDARMYEPTCVTTDGNGNLFICDFNNHVIRRVGPTSTSIGLASLEVTPQEVYGGLSATGTVTLTDPAPTDATTIALTADNGDGSGNSVTVSAGETQATLAVGTPA